MAPDDRDRNFEKALARHLRPGLPSAQPNASVKARNESCPDSETLAAYHERGLSLQELNSWKQHIASCERCQLVLAHLEATEDIPLGVEAEDNVVAMSPAVFAQTSAPVRSPAVQDASSLLASPRGILQKAAVPAAAPKATPRPTQWRWLVPVGALAAGLLVWVALHESQPPRLSTPPATQPAVEEAQNRQAAPPPQPVLTAPSAKADKDERARVADEAAATRADANKVAPQKQKQLDQQNAPAPSSHAELSLRKKENRESAQQVVVTAEAQATDQLKAPAAETSGQRDNEKQVQAQQNAPAPSPPAFVSTEASAAPAAPAPERGQTKVESKSGVVGGAVSSNAEIADNKISSNLQSLRPMRLAKARSSRLISAPEDKLLWLVGPGGLIKVSSDKGATWKQQPSGVTTDLLAGSAPADQVCWVVGTSGTILRTTDGGAHWFKQNSPLTSDWFSISATDALHARISSAPDPQSQAVTSYETNDGGVTWTQLPTP